MEVKLVVTNGRHAGREIPIKGPKFFIGRAEDCHLRPGSDLVSRHHCVILISENGVKVRDFGSKNGTFVNGERVSPETNLKPGDRLVVGQLDFDVRIVGMPEQAEPTTAVDSATDTSAITPEPVEKPSGDGKTKPAGKDTVKVDDDLDISQWFGDEAPSAKTDTQTIDMSTIAQQAPEAATATDQPPKDPEPDEEGEAVKRDVSEAEKERARRAHGGKTTQDAAAEMLKKFFNARR